MDPFEILVEAHRPALKSIVAELIEIFTAHDVRYIISGANALSLYIRPRMTVDVDVLVELGRKEDLDELLASRFDVVAIDRFESKFRRADVGVDIRYARKQAEEFALTNASDGVILGTKLKAASPEALLWLYLLSERPQNFADGISIVRSKPDIDVEGVRKRVRANDPGLTEKLEEILTIGSRPEISYEESRARRS